MTAIIVLLATLAAIGAAFLVSLAVVLIRAGRMMNHHWTITTTRRAARALRDAEHAARLAWQREDT